MGVCIGCRNTQPKIERNLADIDSEINTRLIEEASTPERLPKIIGLQRMVKSYLNRKSQKLIFRKGSTHTPITKINKIFPSSNSDVKTQPHRNSSSTKNTKQYRHSFNEEIHPKTKKKNSNFLSVQNAKNTFNTSTSIKSKTTLLELNCNSSSRNTNYKIKKTKSQGKEAIYVEENIKEKRNEVRIKKWKNNSKLIGYFDDNITGFGKLINKEKEYLYIGNLIEGKSNGIGYYKVNNGLLYQGYFLDNKQNLFGEEIWPEISQYLGEYKNGKKEGYGILKLEDSGFYEGEFKDGFIEGYGSFYFSDLRRYEGMWKRNKMNGYGIIYWPDNSYFEGTFKDDVKEGFGIFYTNFKVIMGYWKDSLLDGKVIVVENGIKKKQLWKMGIAVQFLEKNEKIEFEFLADRVFPY